MHWYENAETWAAIGSLGAVLISLAALYVSYRRQTEQQRREKREELRGALERLVILREEENALSTEQDERVKSLASTYSNFKRRMYLDAAESLARQIAQDVSVSEYAVLAYENYQDADYAEAKEYYELALEVSHQATPAMQADIRRNLGGICFLKDPAVQDIDKGREMYASAIRILENQTHHYSIYTRFFVYKSWAIAEILFENLTQANELLTCAYEEFVKIDTANGLFWINDLRDLAFQWMYLGSAYFRTREENTAYVEQGRLAYREALRIIETLSTKYGNNTNYNIDARGVVVYWWGYWETESGFSDEGDQLLVQAEQEFQRLPDTFPWKEFRLASLREGQPQAVHGETPILPEQELSRDANSLSR
jgi:hypothetical protein